MIRFRLKRDFVDVPVKHARALIAELDRSAWSPEMRRSAAQKVSQAISTVGTLPRVTLSLGEKVTVYETLRDVFQTTRVLPHSLRELGRTIADEFDRMGKPEP